MLNSVLNGDWSNCSWKKNSRGVPKVTWSCLGFLSMLVPTSTSLEWSLTTSSHSKTMFVSRVSQRIDILRLVKWYLWTPLCYFVAILHLFSQSLSIFLWCGSQLLNVTFSFLRARCLSIFGGLALSAMCIRWSGFVPISFCSYVIEVVWLGLVCCRRLILILITVCSTSFHLLLIHPTLVPGEPTVYLKVLIFEYVALYWSD